MQGSRLSQRRNTVPSFYNRNEFLENIIIEMTKMLWDNIPNNAAGDFLKLGTLSQAVRGFTTHIVTENEADGIIFKVAYNITTENEHGGSVQRLSQLGLQLLDKYKDHPDLCENCQPPQRR